MSTIQGANQMSQANPVHSLANVAAARTASKETHHIAGTGIEAKNIHAWFGDKHVIDDVSIDFFLELLQPSLAHLVAENQPLFESSTACTNSFQQLRWLEKFYLKVKIFTNQAQM
jgi:hypothetical protein